MFKFNTSMCSCLAYVAVVRSVLFHKNILSVASTSGWFDSVLSDISRGAQIALTIDRPLAGAYAELLIG